MVSLTATDLSEVSDRLLRSVDIAIRNLLVTQDDPFALANYLWTLQSHGLTSINSDRLVQWGAAWVDLVLLKGEVGARSDEAIAAAGLAAAALIELQVFSDSARVSREIDRFLFNELDIRELPLRSASYAAALILAGRVVGGKSTEVARAAHSLARAYEAGLPLGRSFGMAYVVRLLCDIGCLDQLAQMQHLIEVATRDPRVSYEDSIYLLQALWAADACIQPSANLIQVSEQLVAGSPAWAYIGVGLEEVDAAGDGAAIVQISHLYRAALLDVVVRLRAGAELRDQTKLDARIRESTITTRVAFGGIVAALVVPQLLLASVMVPQVELASRYWLRDDYQALTAEHAMLFLLGVFLEVFLLIFTPVVIWSIWPIMVRLRVMSDTRIGTMLAQRVKWAVTFWAFTIVAGIIGLVGDAFRYTLDVLLRELVFSRFLVALLLLVKCSLVV